MLVARFNNPDSKDKGKVICGEISWYPVNGRTETWLCDDVEAIEGSVDIMDYLYHLDGSIGVCVNVLSLTQINSI